MSHCALTYRWRRWGQELMFPWSVGSLLAILHLDLWMPGHYTDSNNYMAFMNVICDMC